MPTEAQTNRVIDAIRGLGEEYSFKRLDEQHVALAPHGRGTEDGYFFWGELTEAHRRDALAHGVDWDGFNVGERADVISGVLGGEPPSLWVVGIERCNSNEDFARPLTEKQHAAHLRDIAAGYGMTVEEMDDHYEREDRDTSGRDLGAVMPVDPSLSSSAVIADNDLPAPKGAAVVDASTQYHSPPESIEPPLYRVERQLRNWKHDHSPDFAPDPATGRMGTGTTRSLDDAWSVMPETRKLRVLEDELDWTGVSDRDKESLLAREVDFAALAKGHIDQICKGNCPDRAGDWGESTARKLFDEAYYNEVMAHFEFYKCFDLDWPPVEASTRALVTSLAQNQWPDAGTISDFGLSSQKHYEALYYPLRNQEITPLALDAAMGRGEYLTKLAHNAPSNPHRDIEFHASLDSLLEHENTELASPETEAIWHADVAEPSRRHGPPGAGVGEPAAADHVTSPADLVEGNDGASQRQTQGRGISV